MELIARGEGGELIDQASTFRTGKYRGRVQRETIMPSLPSYFHFRLTRNEEI
jgi:hypothetical protein